MAGRESCASVRQELWEGSLVCFSLVQERFNGFAS